MAYDANWVEYSRDMVARRRATVARSPLLKTCHCGATFWARWANTPAVCPACVERVIVCPDCWRVSRRSDPGQLSLFLADVDARLVGRSWSHFALVGNVSRRPRHFDHETWLDSLLTTERPRHFTSERSTYR